MAGVLSSRERLLVSFNRFSIKFWTRFPSALSNLVQDFKRNCEAKGNPGEKWNWHEAELRGFLKQSIPKILEEHSIRVFVDAIDEGGDRVARELVREFQSLVAEPCTKSNSTFLICFTCRHYPIIEFEGEAKICVEKENYEDIVTYVRGRLTDNNAKVSEVRDMIIERASGIFQWARLVVDRAKELLLEEGNKEGQGRNPADPLRPAYTLSGTLGAHKPTESRRY